jgi:hypothetical protein
LRSVKNNALLIFTSFALGVNLAQAAEKTAADFDANANGTIERAEFIRFYLSEFTAEPPRLEEADGNVDGTISEEEFDAWLRSYGNGLRMPLDDATEEAIADFEGLTEELGRSALSYQDAEFGVRGRPQASPSNPLADLGVHLRRDLANVDISGPSKVVEEPKDGALFSLARDIEAGQGTLQAIGSLYGVIPVDIGLQDVRPEPGFKLRGLALIPSFSFDVTENTDDDADEGSSLIFRLAGQGEFRQTPLDDQWLAALYPRLGIAYATDIELDSDVFAIEADLDPVFNIRGNHRNTALIPGIVQARWIATLHSEAGYTVNAGDDTSLRSDEGFLRVGPRLRFDLVPDITAIENWRRSFGYDYRWGVGGTPEETSLIDTSLAYVPGGNSPIELVLSYRKGDTPLLDYRVDTLSFGVGVKF